MLKKTTVMGKDGENKGDTLNDPTQYLEYDFFAWMNNGNPVWVKTIQREEHYYDNSSADTIQTVEYSDGFGRLLQTRSQAEDIIYGDANFGDSGLPADQSASNQDAVGTERDSSDPLNVIVSGWKVYNNNGEVVQQYEPFFDQGFDYKLPTNSQMGQKTRMFYDPRGQVVKTINPDDTEQRVIFGVPLEERKIHERSLF